MLGGRTRAERSTRLALALLISVFFVQHARLPGYQYSILHKVWLRGRRDFPSDVMREIYAIHDLRSSTEERPLTPFECPNAYH